MLHVSKSVTINRPREEVYGLWRDLEKLPLFMQHVRSVTRLGNGRSHWVARAPAGQEVEWDAEIVEERPGKTLAWRSISEGDIRHEGVVQFKDAPPGRGTEVRVHLDYEPPAGKAGAAVARLFGEEPKQQIRDDLRRLKQVLETGEVVLSDGSLEGAGQGIHKQREAQPYDETEEELP
ncbi:MAG TPA: SRPBCC family protein [Candidatus Polarisedimenticolaceae bacterium]|nr:SRPBCC family protein [Candidatus Polarisedimenticolaceae bacterium]